MLAVILAGGAGTRLRPLTFTIPKPLLPLGTKAILEIVVTQLAQAGFTRVVVSLGYMPHFFQAVLGAGAYLGTQLEYSQEPEPLGTAGPLRLVPDLADDFLVLNGDVLTTLNFADMFAFHVANAAWLTIALHRRVIQVDYGVIKVHADGTFAEYVEKPEIAYEVSMGVYCLAKRCLDLIPAGHFDIPQLVQAIVAANGQVACYRPDCYWQDIGRLDDYERASADFIANPKVFLHD